MTPYETITNRIIASLEAGVIPWRKSWSGPAGGGAPRNRLTGKAYRGANFLSLLCSPYSSREWMTYIQAKELGGQVRKGEHGSQIIFWSTFGAKKTVGDAAPVAIAGEEKGRGFMKLFSVFNVEQIDGLPGELPFDAPAFDAIAAADAIADSYLANGGPALTHGGGGPFYSPARDLVNMPPAASFVDSEAYYSTLFHELGHSTGHPSRLDRKGLGANKHESTGYGEEELLAEFSSTFLCSEAGIANDVILEDAAAYIDGWLKAIKSDSRLAIIAAQRAQKVVDYVLGRLIVPAEVAA